MNVFELAMVAAPLAGCIAAAKSAAGHGPGVVAGCAAAGLLIGAAAFLGPFFALTWLWSRVYDVNAPSDSPGAVEWISGTAVVLFAAISPIVAWFVTTFAIARLL